MRIPVPDVLLPADQLGRVHFIGIGGAGLSAIATIMVERGITVSGSDAADSAALRHLEARGARVHVGHAAEHLHDVDTLIVSTAVRPDNVEYAEAQRQHLTILPRSAGLYSVMVGKRTVAVAGTHGKSTTSAMLTVALTHVGADPTYAVGARLANTGTNAHDGAGSVFVAEADESDGAFLVYRPHAAIITNVEADHLDIWGTPEAYFAAFEDFLSRVEPGGFVVCVVDDPGAAELAMVARARGITVVTVGSEHADYVMSSVTLDEHGTSFTVAHDGVILGRVTLSQSGLHYAIDAVAALACALHLGYPFASLAEGLASYAGTERRMQRRGEINGIRVYDTYAHHPREIAGDLVAARALAGTGRVVVAYQPHLVSRTRIFGAEMGQALSAADVVIVTDIYLAREEADPHVTSALITQAVTLPEDRVFLVSGLDEASSALVAQARPGDLVLTMGAGSITSVAGAVLEQLGAHP